MIYRSLLALLIVLAGCPLCAARNAGHGQDDRLRLFCPPAGKAATPDNPSKTEPDLCTDLMRAAENGDADAVRALLSKGADVNARTKHGITALMLAAKEGRLEIVKLLIGAGANVNAGFATHHMGAVTTLVFALRSRKDEVILALIEAGAELNPAEIGGPTPLMQAIHDPGDPALIKTLLEKGADVNLKNRSGVTAIMAAALLGKLEVVQLLIDAGADVNAKTGDGTTALSIAVEENHADIIQLLKKAGARP